MILTLFMDSDCKLEIGDRVAIETELDSPRSTITLIDILARDNGAWRVVSKVRGVRGRSKVRIQVEPRSLGGQAA